MLMIISIILARFCKSRPGTLPGFFIWYEIVECFLLFFVFKNFDPITFNYF